MQEKPFQPKVQNILKLLKYCRDNPSSNNQFISSHLSSVVDHPNELVKYCWDKGLIDVPKGGYRSMEMDYAFELNSASYDFINFHTLQSKIKRFFIYIFDKFLLGLITGVLVGLFVAWLTGAWGNDTV